MAGVGRHMSRSLMSTTRAAARFSSRTASEAATGARGVGASSMPATRPAASSSSFSAKSFFESRRPGAFFARLPGEVACVQSLLPLHNATASARMVSQLRVSAGALLQDESDDT